MAVFAEHFSFLQPGSYLFVLSPTRFGTRSVADGSMTSWTARDIRGHSNSRSLRFTLDNAPTG